MSLTRADGQSQGEGNRRKQPARPQRSAQAARPALPLELEPLGRRIEAYWAVKAGSRTVAAFEALAEELLVVVRRAGPSAVEQLLRQATQAGWPTVNADAWLSHHREELAMARHPAYQEFRAGGR